MTTISPWINFNGNAEEAFNFYKSVFGGEFTTVTRFKDFAGPESKVAESEANKILRITLPINGANVLIGNDVPEYMGKVSENENRSKIHVAVGSKEEAIKICNGLSAGDRLRSRLMKTAGKQPSVCSGIATVSNGSLNLTPAFSTYQIPKYMEGFKNNERLPIAVQEASESDIPALLEIEHSVSNTNTYSAMLTEAEWKEELQKGITYLIKEGEDVAGLISYEQRSPDHIYISGLAVKPEYQGKGIARYSLTRLLSEHPGTKRFDLVTHPDGPGLKLYQSLGFQVEERKEDYYGDGEPRVIAALTRE
jgi:PhnB protein